MGRVHFVGGEKGGVGKSVMARLLVQYWIDRAVDFSAFDTDRSHGALLRHYTGYSEALDVDRMEELDRIVDGPRRGRRGGRRRPGGADRGGPSRIGSRRATSSSCSTGWATASGTGT